MPKPHMQVIARKAPPANKLTTSTVRLLPFFLVGASKESSLSYRRRLLSAAMASPRSSSSMHRCDCNHAPYRPLGILQRRERQSSAAAALAELNVSETH